MSEVVFEARLASDVLDEPGAIVAERSADRRDDFGRTGHIVEAIECEEEFETAIGGERFAARSMECDILESEGVDLCARTLDGVGGWVVPMKLGTGIGLSHREQGDAVVTLRQIKAKGPIGKVLSLLPLLKPGQAMYPDYCKKFNVPGK